MTLGRALTMVGEALSPRELTRLFPGDFPGRGAEDKPCIMLDSWLKGRANRSAVIEQAGWHQGSGVKFRKL